MHNYKSEEIHIYKKKELIKINLYDYIDKNSDFLKKEYLDFIYYFENQKINGKKFRDYFDIIERHNLWQMSILKENSPFNNYSLVNSIKFIAISHIIKKKQIKKIEFKFFDEKFKNYLIKYLENNNLKFLFLDTIKKNNNNIISLILPKIIKSFFYFIIKILNFYSFRENKKNFSSKDLLILSHFSHFDESKLSKNFFLPYQWYGIDKVFDQKNYLQIFNSTKKFKKFKAAFNFVNSEKKLKKEITFINGYLDFSILSKVIWYYLINVFKYFFIKRKLNQNKSKFIKYLTIINKKSIDESFYGSSSMLNLLFIFLFEKFFSKNKKIFNVIYLMENQPWEKAFLVAWKRNNHGRSIGYSHTTVNYWHLNYFKSKNYYKPKISNLEKNYLPDKIAVAGKSAYNFFKKQGIPNNKLIKVESLRYNWLESQSKTQKTHNNKVLILGDYDDQYNIKLLNIIEKIKVKINNNQKYDFYFKPHPASNINVIKNMSKKYIEYKEIKNIYNKYSIVISSNSTSAPLEFAKSSTNIIIFLDKRKLNLSPFKKIENVSYFYDLKSLKKILIKKNFKQINLKNYFYFDKNLRLWSKLKKKMINKL